MFQNVVRFILIISQFLKLCGDDIKSSLDKLDSFLKVTKGITGNEVYFIALNIFKEFQNKNKTQIIKTRNASIFASMRVKKV